MASTPAEGRGRCSARRPISHPIRAVDRSAIQPNAMPTPTSASTWSRAMLKNTTTGVTPNSSSLRIPRAHTPARAPARRSASTPAALDAAMARAIQITALRLGEARPRLLMIDLVEQAVAVERAPVVGPQAAGIVVVVRQGDRL